ncbi:hypothetical protein MCACP_17960 [Neomoorella carbonis]
MQLEGPPVLSRLQLRAGKEKHCPGQQGTDGHQDQQPETRLPAGLPPAWDMRQVVPEKITGAQEHPGKTHRYEGTVLHRPFQGNAGGRTKQEIENRKQKPQHNRIPYGEV